MCVKLKVKINDCHCSEAYLQLLIVICPQIVDAVKSFGKKNKNLVKKCVLFGYGFPLLIPSLAILMDFLMKKNVSFTFYSDDVSAEIC